MLQKGTKAPYFEGKDENGNTVRLTDFADKKLVLYFYPKDSTLGCTAEACDLRDNYERFLALGYHVLGVSRDSVIIDAIGKVDTKNHTVQIL
ncbi:MAG: peroxiredoxin [Bacteroidales bacterium]|nr:peroxiredoxin [Bacteroidales bacterium]